MPTNQEMLTTSRDDTISRLKDGTQQNIKNLNNENYQQQQEYSHDDDDDDENEDELFVDLNYLGAHFRDESLKCTASKVNPFESKIKFTKRQVLEVLNLFFFQFISFV